VLRYIPSTNVQTAGTLRLYEEETAVVDSILNFIYYDDYKVPSKEAWDMLLYHSKVSIGLYCEQTKHELT
jgi:hypothetical protein